VHDVDSNRPIPAGHTRIAMTGTFNWCRMARSAATASCSRGHGLNGYILRKMTPNKVPYYTKLDPELRAAMARYKSAVGVPEAVQIDRALREWLGARSEAWTTSQKATAKAERPRARTRGRK
jgi:hypothetical protein